MFSIDFIVGELHLQRSLARSIANFLAQLLPLPNFALPAILLEVKFAHRHVLVIDAAWCDYEWQLDPCP